MLRFGKTKTAKEELYGAKRHTKICDIDVNNTGISKLIKTKTNFKYLIEYLDEVIRPLVLILPKLRRYVKTFKVKDKNNKLMLFRINDEKLLEKYKTIWTKTEDLENIELNALPYGYIKTKIRTYGDKIYANFRVLNVPWDYLECKSFTVISIDSLLVYKRNYYFEVYLDSFAYEVIDKRMIDYLDDNSSEADEN